MYLTDSPYGALILFVPKKDAGIRFSIDYDGLNKKMVRNCYPLQLLKDIFDHLSVAWIFKELDQLLG